MSAEFRSIACLVTLMLIPPAATTSANAEEPKPSPLVNGIEEITGGADYKQAMWEFLVVDRATGKVVYERHPDQLFVPASTTKLFTCAAAMVDLGADSRIATPLLLRGKIVDGVVQGDLILVAKGDLTFGGRRGPKGEILFRDNDHTYAGSGSDTAELVDADPLHALKEIVEQLKEKGVTRIQGEILVDDRYFQRAQSSGSGPDVISAMLLNDNVVDVVTTPGAKVGDYAAVKMTPETAFVQMENAVVTVADGEKSSVDLVATGPTQFILRGKIALGEKKKFVSIFPINEPTLYARAVLIELLRKNGIRVDASLRGPERVELPSAEELEKLTTVAKYVSPPLSEVIKVTLKVSHNLYASTLPLLVAAKHGDKSLADGLKRQGKILKSLGVPVETISFAGGAGGANADSITPRAAVALIQAMAKRPDAEQYFSALPILGVDGTLASVVDPKSPAAGKVQAKTGTIYWFDAMNGRTLLRSKALAGTMVTAKGTRLDFAMFVNNVPLPKGVPTAREGKTLGKICEVIYSHGP